MPVLTRDGVRLAFDGANGAGRPLVFVHGWCCDRSYLRPQFDHFATAGHGVLAPDLRGHGESDAPEGAYAIRTFAEDLAWLCARQRIKDVVVVGHSMGGIVAFDLAVRYPELVAAVVMIDSAVARPVASRAALPAFIARLEGPEAVPAMQDYVRQVLFLPTDSADRRQRILAAMARTPRHVMVGALQGMYDFDPEEAQDKPLPPMLFVSSNGTPLCDLARLATIVPGLTTAQTAGSGHFCPLEVPDQVNAMLGRFVTIVDDGGR